MASVYKRPSDKKRGADGKWTCKYKGEDGEWHSFAGVTDKTRSLELARHREMEAARVREGLIGPHDRKHREAAFKSPAQHVVDYQLGLLAKDDTPRHAQHTAGVLIRLFRESGITTVADLSAERIQAALARMLAAGRSPRTCNHALQAAKGFARWLESNHRIRELPRGLMAIRAFNEEIGRKRERRAATMAQVEALFRAAESGPDMYIYGSTKSKHHKIPISGSARAALYRLALGTGFRANELRSLLPEWFALDGPEPSVTIPAEHTKNGEKAVQPIAREDAEGVRRFIEAALPGKPVLIVPDRTAQMLRVDLAAAGIPYQTSEGFLDFHALRATYVSHLIASGASIKVVQKLARHSTPVLTLAIYAKVTDPELWKALEKKIG